MAELTEIIDEIEALTTHCRPPIMSVEQRSRWQQDWAQDLAKFPLEAIQAALRQWRQGESLKFPTPGQLIPLIERTARLDRQPDDAGAAWRYDIPDAEYRALSLREKVRHHRAAASHCRLKAGPMPHKGAAVRKEDMPKEWHDWRNRAANHDAEAQRLQQSIGQMDQRA